MAPPRKKRALASAKGSEPKPKSSHYVSSLPIETKEMVWEIKNFETFCKIKDALNRMPLRFKAGESIDLPSKWEFTFDFDRDEDKDDISFFFALREYKGPETEIYANFSVLIKRTNGTDFLNKTLKIQDMRHRQSQTDTDENDIEGDAWGWSPLTTLSRITSNPDGVLVNGSLTLYLKFYLYSTPKVSNLGPKVKKCGCALSEDLGQLLETGAESDVTFVTSDGQKVKAHRAVLSARSQVFAAMLGTDMREKSSGEIKLEDIGSDALEIVLEYIYAGSIDESWLELEEYEEVVKAADKYLLPKLKHYCDKTLGKKCTGENAMDLMRVAGRYSLPTTTKTIRQFIKGNLDVVLDNTD